MDGAAPDDPLPTKSELLDGDAIVEASNVTADDAPAEAPPEDDAPADPLAWQPKLLDGDTAVDTFEVKLKSELPPGMNVTVIDGARTLIPTASGPTEIQVGDWIARLSDGTLIRLPYDEAARRLT
jgi:hypothetical protein